LKEFFSCIPLGISERQSKRVLSCECREFKDQTRLTCLDSQIRTDRLGHGRRSRISYLPRPSGAATITCIVVLPDFPPERLRQENRDLRGDLVKANHSYVIGSGVASPGLSRLIASRYQDCAVTVNAPGDICPESLVHTFDSIRCTHLQGLGTVLPREQMGSVLGKELGAGPKGGDFNSFPDDLKVREFPRAVKAAA
jgi:hypothetical protein